MSYAPGAPLDPNPITAGQAIARMDTWTEEPGEQFTEAVLRASRLWSGNPCEDNALALRSAVKAYEGELIERVQMSSGSMGWASDAEPIREELRGATMIVEVEGQTMGGIMLQARGCHIAYKDSSGKWRGVGSSKRPEVSS